MSVTVLHSVRIDGWCCCAVVLLCYADLDVREFASLMFLLYRNLAMTFKRVSEDLFISTSDVVASDACATTETLSVHVVLYVVEVTERS